jgi:hypothetical protein
MIWRATLRRGRNGASQPTAIHENPTYATPARRCIWLQPESALGHACTWTTAMHGGQKGTVLPADNGSVYFVQPWHQNAPPVPLLVWPNSIGISPTAATNLHQLVAPVVR